MPYDPDRAVFSSVAEFHEGTSRSEGRSGARIIHCINPFSSKPGSEHHRAQQVTLASMTRARDAATALDPDLTVEFAKVTLGEDFQSPLIDFGFHETLETSVLDLKSFNVPRPLPLVMDILTAPPLGAEDIFVFTNVDIALSPSFYGFIGSLFSRGADCAIINRRTVSGIYSDEGDLPLIECEVGELHPGFDCFALRGALRDRLLRYEACVGIGGVMLPLVHQLLAFSEKPVVLLDAHATFHLGNDKTWVDEKFSDYTEHNRQEIDRIFATLLKDDGIKARFLERLTGAHRDWVFPDRLKALAGLEGAGSSEAGGGLWQRLGFGQKR